MCQQSRWAWSQKHKTHLLSLKPADKNPDGVKSVWFLRTPAFWAFNLFQHREMYFCVTLWDFQERKNSASTAAWKTGA